jgi:hypothetical protein
VTETTALQDLILGYCRQVGGLVEPPAYGVHEVLLPDEVAARWGVEPIQRFVFTPEAGAAAGGLPGNESVTLINYSHPLLEMIVEELRRQSANGLFFVNDVRLDKPDLYAAVEKSLALPNAKLFPIPGASKQTHLYHLVRFNFKASLISDEKRELILPVWMNLQGGYAVNGAEIERLAILDAENQFDHLAPASAVFMHGEQAALSPEVFGALLERARQAAQVELAPALQGLQNRLQHFFELDCARLDEYYNDLIKDADKRLRNAEDERQPVLKAKLTAIQSERQAKLADVEQKYRLRVELELVNLALIAQPKLDLMVQIKKRTVAVQRRAVWDPLRHIVEPLICDVCGQPGDELYLCEESHLVHASCLAPQCVECKRTYCQRCTDKVQICVVCDRPVCNHSLVKCPECQRVTCHDHMNECHAAEGAPRRLQAESAPPVAKVSTVASPAKAESTPLQKPTHKKETSKAKLSASRIKSVVPPAAFGSYLEIYADPAQGTITAYVMAKKREIAMRTWEMTDEGISSHCVCEKGWQCKHNGIVYRPAPDSQLEAQIMSFVSELRTEYRIGVTKVHYYQIRQGQAFDERKLRLPVQWREATRLAKARQGFDQLIARNTRR